MRFRDTIDEVLMMVIDDPYYFTGRRADFIDEFLCLQYSRNRYYDNYTIPKPLQA